MNKMKLSCGLMAALGLMQAQAGAWRTAIHEGAFTNSANWGDAACPTNTGALIQFALPQNGGEYSVSVSDVESKAKQFINTIPTGCTWLFDVADSVFTMPAIPVGETAHDANPITWHAGASRPASKIFGWTRFPADTNAFVCSWSDARVAVTNTVEKDVSINFSRGIFSFAGAEGTDDKAVVQISSGHSVNDGRDPGYGASDPFRTFSLNYSNVTSVYGNLSVGAWATEGTKTTVSGGKLAVLGELKSSYAGTNASAFVAKDGAELTVGGSLTVRATEKNVSFALTNATLNVGATLVADGSVDLSFGAGADVTVTGSVMASKNATVTIADGAQLSASMMGDAQTSSPDDEPRFTVAGEGTKLTLYDLCVGNKAGGSLTVSGGEVAVEDYFYFGYSLPTAEAAAYLTQSGGRISANHIILCRSSDSAYRKVYLSLNGGEIQAYNLYGSKTKINGNKGYAQLSADGGTYRASKKCVETTYPFIGGIDLAELGPKGLTIATEYENLVCQSFTNKVGETGHLFLTGSGSVRIGMDSHQDELVSRVATLSFEPAVSNYAANVVATNGTAVSFANSTALQLGGLTLDGGTVVTLAPTTRLTVTDLSLGAFALSVPGSLADGSYPFVTVKGLVSAEARDGWILADLRVTRTVTQTYNLTCGAYDQETDTTVLSLVVGPTYVPALTDAEDLPPSIDELCVLGALAFTQAKDYVLSGSNRLFFEDSGNGAISVASGAQQINVPTLLSGMLKVSVPGGASLAFNATVTHGGIEKSGTGVLAFGADQVDALPNGLTLKDGTWRTAGTWDGAGAVKIQAPNPSNAVLIANAKDVTVPGFSVAVNGGAIVKTGAGRFAVENAGSAMQLYGNWSIHGQLVYGVTVPAGPMDFPADGTPPTKEYSAFNIVEGEMALRGTGAAAPTSASQYFSTAEVFVGMRSPLNVAAAPGLVIDHAKVDLGGTQRHVFIGAKPVATDILGVADKPYVTISNKAEVVSHGVIVGYSCDGTTTAEIHPQLVIDDAAWKINVGNAGKFVLSGGKTCHTAFDLRNTATFLSGKDPATWMGDATVTVDGGSLFAGLTTDAPAAFQFGDNASGSFTVKNDATFKCAGVFSFVQGATKILNSVDFRFDGGFLDPAAADFTFVAPPANCHLTALAGGLKLAVPTAGTWTLPPIVDGSGPIIACGAGTVALDGVFTNAFAGAGTFAGGTLDRATVKINLSDELFASDAPTFANTTVEGRLYVDLGRTAENPVNLKTLKNITVMNYTGEAPSPTAFKLVGTGLPRAYGTFSVGDGKVVLESATATRGVILIYR